MELDKHHSHWKDFRAKPHQGNAILRHNRSNGPSLDLNGHWINSLQDPTTGTSGATVLPRKEFVCQLVELHMSRETVPGTTHAWWGQAETAPRRNLARATLLASAAPRVHHPTQQLLREVDVGAYAKKGWAFFTRQLRFQQWEHDPKHQLKLCPVKSQSCFCTSILLVHRSWRHSLLALGHTHLQQGLPFFLTILLNYCPHHRKVGNILLCLLLHQSTTMHGI